MTQQGWQPPSQSGPQGYQYPRGGYPPNGFSPSQSPHPAPPPKRGAFRVMVIVLVVLLVVLVAVVTVGVVKKLNSSDGSPAGGSSAGGSSKGGGSGDDARKIPFTAQFDSWLSDAYASGIGTDWKADGQAVGTSSDRSKVVITKRREQQLGSDGQWTYVAHSTIYDVLTGKPVHEFTDIDCYESLPAIDGKLTCIRLLPPGGAHQQEVGQLDIASGKFTAFYAADFVISAVRVIGISDGRIYAHTQSELGYYFIVFDANSTPETNTIIWQSDKIPTSLTQPCVLLGEHIGCEAGERLTVFSAKDGSPGIVVDDPKAVSFVWTEDAVIWGDFFDEERTVSYYDGKTDVTKEFPYSANRHDDVVLPRDEVLDKRGFDELDSDGNQVVRRDYYPPDNPMRFVATGAELKVDTHDSVVSSTTGKVVVTGLLSLQEKRLVTPDGTQVGTAPERSQLVDGILVEFDATTRTTVVHPPAK